jgi:hypothetical protein
MLLMQIGLLHLSYWDERLVEDLFDDLQGKMV